MFSFFLLVCGAILIQFMFLTVFAQFAVCSLLMIQSIRFLVFQMYRGNYVLATFGQQRPLVCVWKSDGRYQECSAANDSKAHE